MADDIQIPYAAGQQPLAAQPPPSNIAAILAALGQQGMTPQAAPSMPAPAPGAQLSSPTPQPVSPVAAGMAPQTPVAPSQPDRPQEGPVKSILKSFLYGAGESLKQHVGLPTDFEKQQAQAKMDVAQQGANDLSAYRQAQTGGLQNTADAYQRSLAPIVVPTDFPIPSLAGKTVTKAQYDGLLKAVPAYAGKIGSAQIGADSRETVAGDNNNTKKDIASANIQAREDIKKGDWAMAAKRIAATSGVAGGNLNLRQLEYRMRAYGTGGDGQPLPGVEFDETGRPVGTATQANIRPTAPARNAAERGESMNDIETRIRGALNDPQIRSELGPVSGRINDIKGHAGILDGPVSELRNDLVSYGAFQAGLHPVRGIGALQYFDKVLGGLGQNPEELLGKLDSNRATSNSVIKVGHGGTTTAPASSPAPTSAHPFFSQFGGSAVKP